MTGILTIAHLTIHEARRRRILLAAVVLGAGYLTVYGTGLYFVNDEFQREAATLVERIAISGLLILVGIYGANFLAVAAAVLLAVDTLSGEIGSGVMETVATKPLRRVEIVLGKWLGYLALTVVYLLAMCGTVLWIGRMVTGSSLAADAIRAVPFMILEVTVLLTITIVGGSRFSTITNGIVAFGFWGLAFIGGFVEQIGIFAGNMTARDIGTAVSLINPSDALWRMAMYHLMPPVARQMAQDGPPMFVSGSTPTVAMVVWSIGFIVAGLALATRIFNRRVL